MTNAAERSAAARTGFVESGGAGGAALAATRDMVRPVTLTDEQRLPAAPALEAVLPGGGVRRGSVVGLEGPGSTSLLWSLLAPPTEAGSWAVLVGLPAVGLLAAADAGVALERLAVVAPPGGSWATVLGALLDGFDLVVAAPDRKVRAGRRPPPHRPGPGAGDGRGPGGRRGRLGLARGCRPAPGPHHPGLGGAGPGPWPPAAPPGPPRGQRSPRGRPSPGRRPLVARRGRPRRRGRGSGSPCSGARWRRDDASIRRQNGSAGAGGVTSTRTMVVWCPDWPLVAAGVDLPCPPWSCTPTGWWPPPPRPGPRGSGWASAGGRPSPAAPRLELVDHDPARDARAFEAVAAGGRGLHPPGRADPPRRLLVPHPGPVPLLRGRRGPGPAGSAGLVADARSAGARRRVGVADGPFAARLAARRRPVVVPPGATPAFLAPLPRRGARPAEALTDVLDPPGHAHPGRPRRPARARPGGPLRLAEGSGPTAWPPGSTTPACPTPATPARPGRQRRARPPGRAGRRRRLRGQAPGRRPARPPRRAGAWPAPGCWSRPRPSTARSIERLLAPRGGAHRRRHGRPGALAARRLAQRQRPPAAPPAGISPPRASRPTRSWPPAAASSASGAARPRRRAGGPGPRPGRRACSGPTRSPCPSGGAGAARPSRSRWSRPTPSTSPSARLVHRAESVAAPGPVGCPPPSPARVLRRAGAGRGGRRGTTGRWGSAAGAWPPRPRPGCGSAPGPTGGGGLGRALAGRRALVGPRQPPSPGPLPGPDRRRHGPLLPSRTAGGGSRPPTTDRAQGSAAALVSRNWRQVMVPYL